MQWSKELYASLLPHSWKNYDGIYESLLAGQMGRTDIIMHGTTVDPMYYKNETYFPNTPTLGCLCSDEEWDENGLRINSNLQKIDDALDNIGAVNGYVVVINISDAARPVTINDVAPLIEKHANQ